MTDLIIWTKNSMKTNGIGACTVWMKFFLVAYWKLKLVRRHYVRTGECLRKLIAVCLQLFIRGHRLFSLRQKKSTHSKKAMRSIMTKQSNREKQRHQTTKLKRRWMLRISRPITGLDLRTANRRKGNPKQISRVQHKVPCLCFKFIHLVSRFEQISIFRRNGSISLEIWSAETFEAAQVIRRNDI